MKNCTKRKHEYRIHEPLSNGQWLNLYFEKAKHCNSIHVWTVGLCISGSPRIANEWYTSLKKGYRKLNNKTTGKCGLEGLRKALEYICTFADNLKLNEELHVEWSDDKRKYAYRGLLKRKFYVDEVNGFYHKRNLSYWQPNETAISELTGKVSRKVSRKVSEVNA
jgi:hypothetical protein